MVYIIHFEQKFKHAQHYIGYCNEGGLERRLKKHRAGTGSKLLRAVVNAGIIFNVVRIYPDKDRSFERQLKNLKNAPRICPVCAEVNHAKNKSKGK